MESADARHTFYTFANWVYQIGVFLSRSSGLLYQACPCLLLCHFIPFAEIYAGQSVLLAMHGHEGRGVKVSSKGSDHKWASGCRPIAQRCT